MSRSDYAIDLNGDGRVDNQLGNIVAALTAQGIDVQTAANTAIQNGDGLELEGLVTVDGNAQNDPAAATVLQSAEPMPQPDFSGQGSFTVDMSVAPGTFTGMLANARYTSENPVTTTSPVACVLKIVISAPAVAASPIALPMNGCHIVYT